jgi:hypothetical protein
MAIVRYNINPNDKTYFADLARLYNVSIATLAQCNNCYTNIPIYAQDNNVIKNRGYVNIPIPNNGGVDDNLNSGWYTKSYESPTTYTEQSATLSGTGSDVILTINDNILSMPCYPTSISDSLQITYNSETIPYRTEPYLNFANSGPRIVQVAFNLHREMTNSDGSDIDRIINVIQSASYPKFGDSNAVKSTLKVGNQLYISGVINGGISTSYSGPIIDGKYNVCDISFSITEVRGKMISCASKSVKGSFMD